MALPEVPELLLSIRGGYFALLPQFFPVFDIGGDEPRPRFFSVKQSKWRPKKRSSPKSEEFFFPNSSVADRLQVIQMKTRVKIIGGDADVDHSQIIGGMQSNYWKAISSPGFGTPGLYSLQPILILSMWTSSRKAGNNNFYSSIHSIID